MCNQGSTSSLCVSIAYSPSSLVLPFESSTRLCVLQPASVLLPLHKETERLCVKIPCPPYILAMVDLIQSGTSVELLLRIMGYVVLKGVLLNISEWRLMAAELHAHYSLYTDLERCSLFPGKLPELRENSVRSQQVQTCC